jgi:hypothetical protein
MTTLSVIVIFVVTIFILLIILGRTLNQVYDHTRALGRIEMKLDLLLRQANIDFAPYKDLPREVVDALRRGKKLEAIKSYRAATGVGLKQAKDQIEEVERRAGN